MNMQAKDIGVVALWAAITFQFGVLHSGHQIINTTNYSFYENGKSTQGLTLPIAETSSSRNASLRGTGKDQITQLLQGEDFPENPLQSQYPIVSPKSNVTKHLMVESATRKSMEDLLLRSWELVEPNTHVIVPFAIYRARPIYQDSITVTVHADTRRLNRLLYLIRRWKGPASASILVTGPKDIENVVSFVLEHKDELQYMDIHIHLENMDAKYPHNLLRQQALAAVETDYFLALDVDFVTAPNAAVDMQQLLRRDSNLRSALENKVWMVLPAFNRNLRMKINDTNVFEFGEKYVMASNREEAKNMWDNGMLEPFHLERFRWGHGRTNFDKWYDWSEIDDSFFMTKYEVGFEPYVLGYKSPNYDLPKYWAGFRGFGYNKFTYFAEAHYMGFQFGVLRDFFVTHLPHSYGKRGHNEETDKEAARFGAYMKATYNLTSRQVHQLVD